MQMCCCSLHVNDDIEPEVSDSMWQKLTWLAGAVATPGESDSCPVRLPSKSLAAVALPAASVPVGAVLLSVLLAVLLSGLLSVPDGRCSTPWLTWLGAFWLGLALALAFAGAGAAAWKL